MTDGRRVFSAAPSFQFFPLFLNSLNIVVLIESELGSIGLYGRKFGQLGLD